MHFGTDTINNLGLKIWELVPDELKNASSLLVFKNLGLKHGPLVAALVGSVKLMLKILVLF